MEVNKRHALLVLGMGNMMYGTIGLFTRYFDGIGYSALDIAFARLAITALVLLPILLFFNRELLKVGAKGLLFFLSFGVFKLLADIFFVYSLGNISLALASILQMMFPFYVIILSLFIFKERIDGRKLFAVLAGFVGCTLLTGSTFATGNIESMGIVAALISGLCIAIYILGGTFSYKRGYHPAVYLFYCSFLADLIALPFINHNLVVDTIFHPDVVPFLFGLGVIASLIPMFFDAWSAKYLSPTIISIVSMLEVVSATIIGAIAFGEVLGPLEIFGMLLVLLSILIINIRISINAKRFFERHPEVLEQMQEQYSEDKIPKLRKKDD
ncbi:MAG: DMT family transporter [Candidatus Methanomethylophilaceae archaeon]|nr:DMT family transporter [Candidatus Methanomethylophilaceae archaeon]